MSHLLAGILITGYLCGGVLWLIALGGITPPKPGLRVQCFVEVMSTALWPLGAVVAICLWLADRKK